MTVFRLAMILPAVFIAGAFAAPPGARAAEDVAVRNASAADISAQHRRARPQIRIYRYPQPPFWEYPRPGVYSWPGPGAKRDCRAWDVLENRPSGAVMTPRMRCEWVPG